MLKRSLHENYSDDLEPKFTEMLMQKLKKVLVEMIGMSLKEEEYIKRIENYQEFVMSLETLGIVSILGRLDLYREIFENLPEYALGAAFSMFENTIFNSN